MVHHIQNMWDEVCHEHSYLQENPLDVDHSSKIQTEFLLIVLEATEADLLLHPDAVDVHDEAVNELEHLEQARKHETHMLFYGKFFHNLQTEDRYV